MTPEKKQEKLTSYALGELSGSELAQMEKALAEDEKLRGELEGLRVFCSTLRDELHAEPVTTLSSEERRKIEGAGGRPRRKAGTKIWRSAWWWAALIPTAVVCAAALVMVWPRVSDQRGPTQDVVGGEWNEARETKFVAASDSRPESAEDQTQKPNVALSGEEARTSPQVVLADKKAGRVAQRAAEMEALPAARFYSAPNHLSLDGGAGFAGAPAPSPLVMPEGGDNFNTEAYDRIEENAFKSPAQDPLSTFSIDVDTASYSNMRRFLNQGSLPPKDAVRIEELLNYFRYSYPEPEHRPFSVNVEVSDAPWKKDHRLVRIGIQGRKIDWSERPASNLVFLLDVSGSMNAQNKLPLLKKSLKLVVDHLGAKDRVAVVVYAGASGLVLPSTEAGDKLKIMNALEELSAGGSTNGGQGIELAYKVASENFIKSGINRVILATDGDFNVGVTSAGELTRLIEERAKSGVFLSVLGFGMGNYKDSTLEKLAGRGNGNYAYIDDEREAKKVLVEQVGGTMLTIAKDVKIQVEFNPAQVSAYRLIGYENRIMAHQDFNNDKKDAGDIGAGHSVTALYEIVPVGVSRHVDGVDPLKYQKPLTTTEASESGELLTVKLRYKDPNATKSNLVEYAVADKGRSLAEASSDFKFAASVATLGMLLRESEYKENATYDMALDLGEQGLGDDVGGYRKEYLELVKKAKGMKR